MKCSPEDRKPRISFATEMGEELMHLELGEENLDQPVPSPDAALLQHPLPKMARITLDRRDPFQTPYCCDILSRSGGGN